MPAQLMHLKVVLPFEVYLEREGVERIVAETAEGSYGFLPRRLDCVAALRPGILSYATAQEGEVFLAIDEGVLVKTGSEVVISSRNAVGGADLGKLRQAVDSQFLALDERERTVRSSLARLESSFVRRFLEWRHG